MCSEGGGSRGGGEGELWLVNFRLVAILARGVTETFSKRHYFSG